MVSASQSASACACPLCGAANPVGYYEDDERKYLLCHCCALVFVQPNMLPIPLQEVLRYLEHRNEPSDERYVRFLRRLADPLLERLSPGACGLDFGCGPAAVMEQILVGHGFPTVSYDPLFRPDASLLDASYDFLTCSEVVEHVHDPSALFARFVTLLRRGGIIAVMTRFYGEESPFATWWYRRDATHVSFYREDTMRWIAGAKGWSVEFPAPNVALFTVPATPGADRALPVEPPATNS